MKAIIFDTETTGLIDNIARKPGVQPEIVSMAIMPVDLGEGKIGELYYKLFKPSKPIPDNVMKIHGITNEYVKDMQSIESELPVIMSLLKSGKLLIGQNIRFDMDMLDLECRRYNYPHSPWPLAFDLVENSIFLKGFRLSLSNLHIELFGKAFEGAHRADTDVQITAKCAIEMYKRGWL